MHLAPLIVCWRRLTFCRLASTVEKLPAYIPIRDAGPCIKERWYENAVWSSPYRWNLAIHNISYATRHTYCCAFECAVDHFLHLISNGYQSSTYLLLQFLQLCWEQLCFATGLGRRNRGCLVACPRKPARNCSGKSSKDCQCEENSKCKLLWHSYLHVDTVWRSKSSSSL